MANETRTDVREVEEEVGKMIVRRFTDQLNGDPELERATKAAQEQRDEAEEAAYEMKLRSYYDDTSEDSS